MRKLLIQVAALFVLAGTTSAWGQTSYLPAILSLLLGNDAPTVSITAPASGATFGSPANITLSAAAADDVAVSKVEFFSGASLIGTKTAAPWTITWSNVGVGNYTMTAKATDNEGVQTTSAAITLNVQTDPSLPSVSLVFPPNGTTFPILAPIIVSASATDAGGQIVQVEFFANGVSIGIATSTANGVYGVTWTPPSSGPYTLTAVATDNLQNTSTSAAHTVTINAPGTETGKAAYAVYTDHLNTPRAVTNQAGAVRWRWENDDPFGANVANDNPGGLGPFVFNLRFPGQYFDAETGLHYNYQRDGYDSATGRYTQSDPIGLAGGLNTYSYVGGNPLSYTDPLGLLVWNYGPTSWGSNLTTGSPYTPFPGAPSISIPAFVGGATSIDWWITSACVCDSGGYRFIEFTVDVFASVRLRSSYPGGYAQASWSRRAEGDHVADLGAWQGGSGRSTAQSVENQLKGRLFPSLEECENQTKQLLQQGLANSAGGAFSRSHSNHDLSGRHTYSNPARRP